MNMTSEEREREFLAELTKLSQKYGMHIGGCGCCDSPWVAPNSQVGPGKSHSPDRLGRYEIANSGRLRWES